MRKCCIVALQILAILYGIISVPSFLDAGLPSIYAQINSSSPETNVNSTHTGGIIIDSTSGNNPNSTIIGGPGQDYFYR
jgi:hypothetical protein